jgi:hypothetical protein
MAPHALALPSMNFLTLRFLMSILGAIKLKQEQNSFLRVLRIEWWLDATLRHRNRTRETSVTSEPPIGGERKTTDRRSSG